MGLNLVRHPNLVQTWWAHSLVVIADKSGRKVMRGVLHSRKVRLSNRGGNEARICAVHPSRARRHSELRPRQRQGRLMAITS